MEQVRILINRKARTQGLSRIRERRNTAKILYFCLRCHLNTSKSTREIILLNPHSISFAIKITSVEHVTRHLCLVPPKFKYWGRCIWPGTHRPPSFLSRSAEMNYLLILSPNTTGFPHSLWSSTAPIRKMFRSWAAQSKQQSLLHHFAQMYMAVDLFPLFLLDHEKILALVG